jgi:hypothetical protein
MMFVLRQKHPCCVLCLFICAYWSSLYDVVDDVGE